MQATTRVIIPKIVTTLVVEECLTTLNKRLQDLTERDVRKILNNRGFNTFADQIPAILKATKPNYKPIELPPQVEAALCSDFIRFERAFFSIKKRKGSDFLGGRKSMLNYNFLCKKFCEARGLTKFLTIWKSTAPKITKQLNETYVKVKQFL